MSYTVYTTEGFVLALYPVGEASSMYSLYTKDFGLVTVKAQGVRLLGSKLRYNLDVLAFATFSLVKGREVWRLTGVSDAVCVKDNKLMKARVFSLVRRLVQGEEVNQKVFRTLYTLVNESHTYQLTGKQYVWFEVLVLMHILSALGYLDIEKLIGIDPKTDVHIDQLRHVESRYSELVGEINKAIKATQM